MNSIIDQLNNQYEYEEIQKINIELLDDYKNHPFHLYEDERLQDMIESISNNGIISPIIVRKKNNRYEILSGHNRVNVAKILNYQKVPCIIKDVDDTTAEIIMIESNLIQRSFSELSYTEKAIVLNMKYKDKKIKQGTRNDINNSEKIETRRKIAEEFSLSESNVYRYLKINDLIEELQTLLDEKKLNFSLVINLSKLEKNKQKILYDFYLNHNLKINQKLLNSLILHSNLSDEKFKEHILGFEIETDEFISFKFEKYLIQKNFKNKTKKEIKKILENFISEYS